MRLSVTTMRAKLLLCFILADTLLLTVPLSAANTYKRNILLVLIDDLRPALGCYGDSLAFTPHIDALSQRSFIFTNAFAQQALCGPSRTSFLTSRSPHSLKLYDVHQYWRKAAGNFTSLPQFFKEEGYHTASFGKVFHPGKCSNFSDDQPYSWSEDPFHPSTERFKNAAVCPSVNGKDPSSSIVCPVEIKTQPQSTLPDIQTLQAARSFIQRHQGRRKGQPFFLAVGFHKPHIPLKFPKRFLRKFPLQNISLPSFRVRPPSVPSTAWNPWLDLKERDDIRHLNISFPWGNMPDDWAIKVKQSYYAAVSFVDELIGKLLRDLDIHGLKNNTIILLTSDHGWSLGEHGEWSKYSNYEVATRVPFLLHVPGVFGRLQDNLVELLDIFPTLVDLSHGGKSMPKCSMKRPEIFCSEGRSLEPLLNIGQEEISWRDAVLSLYPRPCAYPSQHPNSDQPRLDEISIMGYSIRTIQHRYTEWVAFDPVTNSPNWNHTFGSELYDHSIDKEENLNLSGREALKSLETSFHLKLQSMIKKKLL